MTRALAARGATVTATGDAFTLLSPDAFAVAVTATDRCLRLAARTLTTRVASAPAASVPTRKHAMRPDLAAPRARVITMFAGSLTHDTTDVAAEPPVLRVRTPTRSACPLSTHVREGSTVAWRDGPATGTGGAAHADPAPVDCRKG